MYCSLPTSEDVIRTCPHVIVLQHIFGVYAQLNEQITYIRYRIVESNRENKVVCFFLQITLYK